MTKTSRRVVYALAYVAGLALLAMFLATPVNKYEWMRQAGLDDSATLPHDPDQVMRLAIVSMPLFLVTAAILWIGLRSDSRALRLTAIAYCLVAAIVAVAKVLG